MPPGAHLPLFYFIFNYLKFNLICILFAKTSCKMRQQLLQGPSCSGMSALAEKTVTRRVSQTGSPRRPLPLLPVASIQPLAPRARDSGRKRRWLARQEGPRSSARKSRDPRRQRQSIQEGPPSAYEATRRADVVQNYVCVCVFGQINFCTV